MYLRYLQQVNVAKRFPWIYTHAKSQSLEALEFYVITALSLAKKAANQLQFFDKSWECALSTYCKLLIDLRRDHLNENLAKMLPQESFFQSITKSNLFAGIQVADAKARSKLGDSFNFTIFAPMCQWCVQIRFQTFLGIQLDWS